MLENSSLAFFEIHKLPTFKLFTFVRAFSILSLSFSLYLVSTVVVVVVVSEQWWVYKVLFVLGKSEAVGLRQTSPAHTNQQRRIIWEATLRVFLYFRHESAADYCFLRVQNFKLSYFKEGLDPGSPFWEFYDQRTWIVDKNLCGRN